MGQNPSSTRALELCYDRWIGNGDYDPENAFFRPLSLVSKAWLGPCREASWTIAWIRNAHEATTFMELLSSPHCTIIPYLTNIRMSPDNEDHKTNWSSAFVVQFANESLRFRDLERAQLFYRNRISVDLAYRLALSLQGVVAFELSVLDIDELSSVAHVVASLPGMLSLVLRLFEDDDRDVPEFGLEDRDWHELLIPKGLVWLETEAVATPFILDWFTSHDPDDLPKHISRLTLHDIRVEDTHMVSLLLNMLGPSVQYLELKSHSSEWVKYDMIPGDEMEQDTDSEEPANIDLSLNTSLDTLNLLDVVSAGWLLPSLANLKESKLISVDLEHQSNWEEAPMSDLDDVLQGPQFSNLQTVTVFVAIKYIRKIKRLFAESDARNILVLKQSEWMSDSPLGSESESESDFEMQD